MQAARPSTNKPVESHLGSCRHTAFALHQAPQQLLGADVQQGKVVVCLAGGRVNIRQRVPNLTISTVYFMIFPTKPRKEGMFRGKGGGERDHGC